MYSLATEFSIPIMYYTCTCFDYCVQDDVEVENTSEEADGMSGNESDEEFEPGLLHTQ